MGLVIEVQTIPNALILHGLFVSSLIVVCSAKGTMQHRHSQSVAGSRHCIVSVIKKVIESFVYGREI